MCLLISKYQTWLPLLFIITIECCNCGSLNRDLNWLLIKLFFVRLIGIVHANHQWLLTTDCFSLSLFVDLTTKARVLSLHFGRHLFHDIFYANMMRSFFCYTLLISAKCNIRLYHCSYFIHTLSNKHFLTTRLPVNSPAESFGEQFANFVNLYKSTLFF